MRLLDRVGSPQAAVAVLTAISAGYLVLVVLGNITDYGTNHAFVRHVLAMDTTFRSPGTAYRAITNPTAVTAAYVLIIAWEAATALVLSAALVAWVRGKAAARRLSSLGWVMQALLFGGGFVVIGGEWFQMWQSQDWNGLAAAYRNLAVAVLGLVLLHSSTRPGDRPDAER
ncbi:DUF2165 domain-containing protein [Saccharothrix algeriensis]|uniref:DUF2165 domain-containing protein n=1 Tax=Saccharothrix algeriensis TaxID=173560 RepID=A0A8T8I3I8_9PSEU|nr:DUF2165 domain-containing protein [Saccharothrix algeriensis]QTR05415.1 DUF2165 domain-containing protein [Saccharothrix algeriensis]